MNFQQMKSKIKKELIQPLSHHFSLAEVILFGSYAWSSPTDESDVDLLIIVKGKHVLENYSMRLQRKLAISKFCRNFRKNI